MTRSPARTPIQSVRHHQGFTLVEVLLVLAILGVIAAMVVPNLLGRQKAANQKATMMSISSVENAAKQYAIAHDGEFPTSLDQLLNPPAGSDGKPMSPFLEKEPKDAWGTVLNYKYEANAMKPHIWSNGADRKEGGDDDVSNNN